MQKLGTEDSRAPYLQVADQIIASIADGKFQPGEQLPALSVIADECGVAVGTVRSALGLLRDQGIVVTRPGSGSFVRTDLDIAELPKSLPRNRSSDLAEVLKLLREINERLINVERRLSS